MQRVTNTIDHFKTFFKLIKKILLTLRQKHVSNTLYFSDDGQILLPLCLLFIHFLLTTS